VSLTVPPKSSATVPTSTVSPAMKPHMAFPVNTFMRHLDMARVIVMPLGGRASVCLVTFSSSVSFCPPLLSVSHGCGITRRVPVRGKYSKYSEYRFRELKGDPGFKPIRVDTIAGLKSNFHWKPSSREGYIMRRWYPCFCPPCMTGCPTQCKNIDFCGIWQEVAVKSLK